jgi:hypothetical protein
MMIVITDVPRSAAILNRKILITIHNTHLSPIISFSCGVRSPLKGSNCGLIYRGTRGRERLLLVSETILVASSLALSTSFNFSCFFTLFF